MSQKLAWARLAWAFFVELHCPYESHMTALYASPPVCRTPAYLDIELHLFHVHTQEFGFDIEDAYIFSRYDIKCNIFKPSEERDIHSCGTTNISLKLKQTNGILLPLSANRITLRKASQASPPLPRLLTTTSGGLC